jgi:hypothetical protein
MLFHKNSQNILDMVFYWRTNNDECTFNSRSKKKKLLPHVEGFYYLIVLRDQDATEQQTILVPVNFSHIPFSKLLETSDEDSQTIPLTSQKKKIHFFLWYT